MPKTHAKLMLQKHPATALRFMGAYYFFLFASHGALLPFFPLILRHHGLTETKIGIAMALFPASRVVWSSVWGFIADVYSSRTRVLGFATLMAGCTLLLLLIKAGFFGICLFILIYCVFRAPLVALADASAMSLLVGRPSEFSRLRVFGSMGFAATAMATGMAMVDMTPWIILVVTSVLLIIGSVSTLGLPKDSGHNNVARVSLGLRSVFRMRGFTSLLVATAIYYFGHASYDAYISLHLRDLGMDLQGIGLAWSLATLSEVALMFGAPRLVRRFGSGRLLTFAAIVATLRFAWLATTTNPWLVIATQPLHAVTFGLWYVCLVDQVQSRASESIRTSVQAAASSSMGVGMFVGFMTGGHVFEIAGGAPVMAIAAFAVSVAAFIFWRMPDRCSVHP